jgi:dTDP-4-dehydrorhamnose 3,5-epimerase-like enzyme
MTQFYDVNKEIGYNYKDPAFDIRLPIEVEVISDKDRDWKFI